MPLRHKKTVFQLRFGNQNGGHCFLSQEIDRITTFPEDAEEPEVSLATHLREVFTVELYGDISEMLLRETADGDILLRMKERRDWAAQFGRIPIVTTTDESVVYLRDCGSARRFRGQRRGGAYDGSRCIGI